MALSYGATFISASAIVGFGGVAATFGMGIQWLCLLNMFMGVVVAFIFFGRGTRKLGEQHNARTFPQLLGMHYKSRSIQIFIATIIFIGMPLYAAVVMKARRCFHRTDVPYRPASGFIDIYFDCGCYVITGGIKGVLYTDALQAVIMFGCMLFLLFWFYKVMDMGFIEANQKLTEIAPLVPDRFKELGHQGWTAMPVTGSPQWYTLVTSLILGVGIGCLAQPQLVVRFMMVESTKQLNRGVLIGCVFLIVTVGSHLPCRSIVESIFMKTEGVVASEAIKDMDKIILLFIDRAMPEWFSAVFMLCILSASMSTLSAQFHTMGAAFGADAFPNLGRRKNTNSTMGVRIGVLCSILLSYIICYTLSAGIIARGTALFMGVCAVTFLPRLFLFIVLEKGDKTRCFSQSLDGALASMFAMLFLHKAEASAVGLCKTLTGKDVLIDVYPWFAIDPILFALPLSVIAIVVVSLMTQEKTNKI